MQRIYTDFLLLYPLIPVKISLIRDVFVSGELLRIRIRLTGKWSPVSRPKMKIAMATTSRCAMNVLHRSADVHASFELAHEVRDDEDEQQVFEDEGCVNFQRSVFGDV